MTPIVTDDPAPPVALEACRLHMPSLAVPLVTDWTVTNTLIPPATATTLGITIDDVEISELLCVMVWHAPAAIDMLDKSTVN